MNFRVLVPLRVCGMVAASLACAALAGCVSRDAYPPQWNAVQADFRCDQLAGTYRDAADASSPGAAPLSLSAVLGVPPQGGRVVRSVRLDVDATGRVTAAIDRLGASGQPLEPLVTALDAFCRNGLLARASSAPASRDSLFIGHDARELAFARSADGALVLHFSERFAGTVLAVLPAAGATSTWYRFPAVVR